MVKFAVVTKGEADKSSYPYVYVEETGAYRELTDSERTYLEKNFEGGDGARPYVKGRFYSKAPDGSLAGFCKRSSLPNGLNAGEVPKRSWWQLW